ncbi:MAG: radical SAM family heme chaperone HemW [Fimbriimonadaceae bacterium]
MPQQIAVYVHIPFCPSKCGYCDFNSYAMSGDIMESTTAAIIAEIERSPWTGIPAKTIFFGGGTPTFIPPEQLVRILEAVVRAHPPVTDAEITSEANPGTVDMAKFRRMREAGFNRISLGAQSFKDDDLLRLGRVHRSGEIEQAFGAARDAGFENINLDLMFALPGQSSRAWHENLRRVIELRPEHLSLYCLTLEPNTPFYKQHLHGQLVLPDDEAQVAMYEDAVVFAQSAGYLQYEISNFAQPGFECRHNLCYWRGEDYAGYGPGAVGCMTNFSDSSNLARHRYTNLKHPERYCAAIAANEEVAFESESLTEANARMEQIMLGIRLNEGLCLAGMEIEAKAMDRVVRRGWVSTSGGRAKLTPEGRHFCSEVALEFI